MPPGISEDADPLQMMGQILKCQILGKVTARVVPALNMYNNEIPTQNVDHTRMGF
jgi:hypothetical protein